MSALIKADSASQMRAPIWNNPDPVIDEPSAADAQILALQHEIAELERGAAKRAHEHEQALEKARAEGKRQAAEGFRRDEGKALEALETGIASSRNSVLERLSTAEGLGLMFSEAALEQLLGDGDHPSLVRGFIKAQLARLRRELVLFVTVSAADFSDDEQMAALRARCGDIRVEVSDRLPSGACESQLRLGTIEFSVAKHWERLQQEIRRLADAGAAT